MQHHSFLDGRPRVTKQTNYILLIDDSAPTRSVLARHIMLNCNLRKRSCAIYRLGERSEPTLTYYENSDDSGPGAPPQSGFDFAVYEASSPRHALLWLENTDIDHLTIISDVMMPNDTEVGLPGLIEGLHELQVGVNLLFVSSEAQSKDYVQKLVNDRQVFFLIKGTDVWSRLPDALVQGADHFRYHVLPRPAILTPPPKAKPAPPVAFTIQTPARVAPLVAEPKIAAPVAPPLPVPQKAPGFWSRLFGWFRF